MSGPVVGGGRPSPRRRRDRRGRGLRTPLLRAGTGGDPLDRRFGLSAPLPGARTRAERFDDLVLGAVEELEERWGEALAGVEFAVEEVPPVPGAAEEDLPLPADPEAEPVALSRLYPAHGSGRSARPPRVVVFRRPVEARALDELDKAELVLDLVIHEVADLLGLPVEEIDPEGHGGDDDWD